MSRVWFFKVFRFFFWGVCSRDFLGFSSFLDIFVKIYLRVIGYRLCRVYYVIRAVRVFLGERMRSVVRRD